MSVKELFIGSVTALSVVAVGIWLVFPLALHGRVAPGTRVADLALVGATSEQLTPMLAGYASRLESQIVTLQIRDQTHSSTLAELGVKLDLPRTIERIHAEHWWESVAGDAQVQPAFTMNPEILQQYLQDNFSTSLKLPRDASLRLTARNTLDLIPSLPGETIDAIGLQRDIIQRANQGHWQVPIVVQIISDTASIDNHEVDGARQVAEKLLADGLSVSANNQNWPLPPPLIKNLLRFYAKADPSQPTNVILGVTLDPVGLQKWVTSTLSKEINRQPQDARFELHDGTLQQISAAITGLTLDVDASSRAIIEHIDRGATEVPLAVATIEPSVKGDTDLAAAKFTALLAQGESSFAGSPANRTHNIKVGTARYHGLLIAPGTEFSFNHFLGPVTAAAGFKPELVIKSNKTVPEYGGGLCQVSTTLFRAAVQAGLPITERRNHAYAVSYYGKPGFDATIYPSVTDLKFKNDTAQYALLHLKVDGTRLIAEIWGTPDGRQVTVDGPHTFDYQPDGAVKAILRRTVSREGAVLHEDSFYSRYRSPQLFPKVFGT